MKERLIRSPTSLHLKASTHPTVTTAARSTYTHKWRVIDTYFSWIRNTPQCPQASLPAPFHSIPHLFISSAKRGRSQRHLAIEQPVPTPEALPPSPPLLDLALKKKKEEEEEIHLSSADTDERGRVLFFIFFSLSLDLEDRLTLFRGRKHKWEKMDTNNNNDNNYCVILLPFMHKCKTARTQRCKQYPCLSDIQGGRERKRVLLLLEKYSGGNWKLRRD